MAIKLTFEAEDKASRKMKGIQKEIKKVSTTTKRETKEMERGWKRANKSISNMRTSIGSLGIAVAAMGVAGVYAMTRLGSASIKAASSLEEIESKFSVVFKGVEDIAKKTTDQLTKDWGFATVSAMKWLASIQDTLVPMGLARDRAAELSGEIVKLSIDIGSFNDQPTEEVMRGIQSALVGNHEAVRAYGIVITEAALKQEAMAQGINKSWNEMTAAEKVLLRYNLIVAGSADAVGDFVRTQDSWANQSRILAERQTELLSAIGAPLMSALSDLQPKITEVVDGMIDWVKANEALIEQNMTAIVEGIAGAMETVAGWTQTVRENWDFIRLSTMIVTGNYRDLGEILGNLNERLTETVESSENIETAWGPIPKITEEVADNTQDIADATEDIYANIKGLSVAGINMVPRAIKFRSEVKGAKEEIEESVSGVEALSNVFSVLNLQGNNFTTSLSEQVRIMRQIHGIMSMMSGLFSFLGIFHTGGMVNRIPGSRPGHAPPGTRQYHSGGVQMGGDERLIRVKTGESVLNQSATAGLGRRGVAALNMGMAPSGGNKFEFHIYNPIGTEEYVMDNIAPVLKKMVTELNMEVHASDALRSRSLS